MGFADLCACFKNIKTEPDVTNQSEEQGVVISPSNDGHDDVMTGKFKTHWTTITENILLGEECDIEAEMAANYAKRTGSGRKSVSAERYDPSEDADDDEPNKIVPKTDQQRKRLQSAAEKIMLLNRLDEVTTVVHLYIIER